MFGKAELPPLPPEALPLSGDVNPRAEPDAKLSSEMVLSGDDIARRSERGEEVGTDILETNRKASADNLYICL